MRTLRSKSSTYRGRLQIARRRGDAATRRLGYGITSITRAEGCHAHWPDSLYVTILYRMSSGFRLFAANALFALLSACSSGKSETSSSAKNDASDAAPDRPSGTNESDAAAAADGAMAVVSKMDTTTETIDVDGTSRSFVLSVPKTYDPSRSYPLILALHGDGQNGMSFLSFAKIEQASGEAAIIAYPDHSEDLFTPYDQNPDQRLVEVIVVALKTRLSIDASKIWGFGYSKGAYQLNELACKKPGLLKAMAIHAGGAPQTRDANGDVYCPDAIGLPVFVTHGANDQPAGGEFGAAYWAKKAGCQPTRSPTSPSICEAYDGCAVGEPVVFCVVPNQLHYPLYADAAAHSWAWFESL